MRARFSVVLVLALAIAGALTISCGGVTDPSMNVTQAFSGTIAAGGIDTPKTFTASSTGEFTAKVTALSPSNNVVLAINLYQGGASGSTCGGPLVNQAQFAALNVLAMDSQIFKGDYCLLVGNVSSITSTVSYTLTISHP